MSAEAIETSSSEDDSIVALRRLKEAETEWAQRLATVKGETERELDRWREETDAAVENARTEAEATAEAMLKEARQQADVEAASIVSEKKALAARIDAGGELTDPSLGAKLVDAVLGAFRSGVTKKGA